VEEEEEFVILVVGLVVEDFAPLEGLVEVVVQQSLGSVVEEVEVAAMTQSPACSAE
jgi:hypothetical protein